MSADPDKIDHIVPAGRPETIEDVRSLLQAAAYNAKYGFNHHHSSTYLVAYNPKRKTHLVTDASPCGIGASLYQENNQGMWVPVDHTSRALSG